MFTIDIFDGGYDTEIRNLSTFVQVAGMGSFTKAARALDYTQSTVSFQIKQMKTELGCLLFERINHTLILTDQGRELLEGGNTVSFLPDFITRRKVQEGSLVYLNVPDMQVDIWQQLIYHRNKWISQSLDAFLRYVSENEFGR